MVLDDLLISLDMSNRDKIIKLLLDRSGKYFDEDYQILLFTHDKAFFEMAKYKFENISDSNWKYLEMYEREEDDILFPLVVDSLTYLERADKYYHINEYEISGNFLRKEAESFCKSFLPKKYHYSTECNIRDLNGLITECINFTKNSALDDILFQQLDRHRKFVLNSTSHDSYDVPKFKSEIKDCLNTLKELRKIKNEPFLKKGDILEFELICNENGDIYKFEIKLEDDFRILKIDGNDNVISKGMINYWVQKNDTYLIKGQSVSSKKDAIQNDYTTLKKFYNYNYEKSDKSKSPNFCEEIIIQKTGEKINDIY